MAAKAPTPRTCLIVDDSRVIRMVAGKIMKEFDFATQEAEDGQQALDACRRALPDLILLDWNMPVMDGMEFLGHLRKLPGGDKVIVIFVTTENDLDHITRALAAGANEYVMKPFDSEIIQGKLAQVGLL